jgi:hypothetical protein
MNGYRATLESFRIGDCVAEVKVEFSRSGTRPLASLDVGEYLPDGTDAMARLMDGLFTDSAELTWDEIEGYRHGPEDCVRHASYRLGQSVVRQALPLKPAGVIYCDGSD